MQYHHYAPQFLFFILNLIIKYCISSVEQATNMKGKMGTDTHLLAEIL